MDQPIKIKVQAENATKRLDAFLSETMSLSRSRATDLIESKLVEVNGQVKKSSYRISEEDEIIIKRSSVDVKTDDESD